MGRLYKRGEIWWAYYRDPSGDRRRQTLATSDKVIAAKRLRQLELVGPADRTADAKSLKDALAYLIDTVYAGRRAGTVSSYRQKARHLVRLLGADRPVNSIERPHVFEYRAARLKEGAADGSVYKELVVLRLAFKEQGIEGVVPKVPVNYTPRTRALTEAQAVEVVGHLAEKRRLWFVIACLLGVRDNELAVLDWSDVDVAHRMVRVRGTKTRGSFRLVPIGEALVPWLEMFDADERVGLVVEGWTNRRRDISAAWWKVVGYVPPARWTQGAKRCGASIAGAPRLSPNDLRRTFTSWLKQAGVDSLAVAHLLGHTSTRMVEAVYGRLTEATYRAAISKLPGCAPAGACTPRVHTDSRSETRESTPETSAAGETATVSVPRAGIEPATRGFSGLEALIPKRGKRRAKLRLVR